MEKLFEYMFSYFLILLIYLHIFSGAGGSFCDTCSLSKEACSTISSVEAGFVIDRSVQENKAIYDRLVDQDGVLLKERGDYPIRKGVTTSPKTQINAPTWQMLHGLLRGCECWTKSCVHLNAGMKVWTEIQSDRFLRAEKEKIQKELNESFGLKWDVVDSGGRGGTTTTGNVVRRILGNKDCRAIFTKNISNTEDREAAEKFGDQLAIIVRVMSSGMESEKHFLS